jgi:hypothetical protein
MRSFAEINQDNIVVNVISCDENGLPSFVEGNYVESTEQTRRASISGTYDQINNKFIDEKPYESWTLNSEFDWESPAGPKPTDRFCRWDEDSATWKNLIQ